MKTITFLGRALMLRLTLLLFVVFATTNTFAQLNSCLVTGDAVSPPYPVAVIEACADGANLNYRATPSVPSTFNWVLSLNTSGASIVGSSTAQSIEIDPGNTEGVFTLTCTVTSIATQVQNFCAVSVAVYKPAVTVEPVARCGAGEITLEAIGVGFNHIVNWYAAAIGGTSLHTGESYTTNINTTTSFWVSSSVITPFLQLNCETPRVEVVATVYPNPIADAGDDDATCFDGQVNSVQLNGSASGGTPAYSYAWTGPATAFLSATNIANPMLVNAPVGVHTFTLTVTDDNGCTDMDEVAIEIYANPICSASNNGPICAGDDVILSETGGDAVSWLWSSNGAATFNDATLQNPTASGAVNGEIFTVMITDESGCTSTCTTTVIVEPCADEGCTLGYWKNHTDRWCESYRTCDLFGAVFVNAPSELANKTLLEALNLNGGGIYNLARQAVAALLNACSDEVDYAGYSDDPQLVINAVNAAFRTGGKEPGMLAYQLDVLNNSGCPLGGTEATSAPNSNCLNGDSKVAVPEKSAVIDSSVDFKVYPVPFEDIINVSYRFEYDTDVTIQVFNLQGGLMYGVVDNLYNNGEVAVKQINLPKTFDQALIIRLTTNKEKLNKNIVAKSSTQR